jgi:hypothetical protein
MRSAFFIALSLAYAACAACAAASAPDEPTPDPAAKVPDFAAQVVASRDNQGLPFVVVDKQQATVWVFAARGALLGSSPALLGLAVGDATVPGIGQRKLESIRPEERTTPAGRFPSVLGRNLAGQEVVWVDYDSGVSLHRMIAGTLAERRAQRLATPKPGDNRVTFGCINVPVAFFNGLVLPTVRPRGSVVYVLPETRALNQAFDFLAADSVR